MAEALLAAASTKAKAVLAKMRSKRGPLIRTLSQKFPRTRVTCESPRSDQASPDCEPDVDSPTETTANAVIGGNFGRFWPVVACVPRTVQFFLRKCHRIATQALSHPRFRHRARANRACGKVSSARCATAARPRTSDRGNGLWRIGWPRLRCPQARAYGRFRRAARARQWAARRLLPRWTVPGAARRCRRRQASFRLMRAARRLAF